MRRLKIIENYAKTGRRYWIYIAFFNRAPDKAGLDYWESRAEELGDDRAIKELSSGFASQPKFHNLYDGLSNREFVESIYGNILVV